MSKSWLKHYPNDVETDVQIPDWSIPDMLEDTADKLPEQVALSFYKQEMTYKELNEASNVFARSLQSRGVKKGDRVAIMLPTCPQFVIAYFGILKCGAIVTQINPMLVERELSHILNDAGAETIVAFDGAYENVKKVQPQTPLKTIIMLEFQPRIQLGEGDTSFQAFLAEGTGQLNPVTINSLEDVAVFQYTGGTTGRSKGAMLTHRNIVANTVQSYEFFKHHIRYGQERTLTVLPLFHVFGMTSAMLLSIRTGATNILLPKFDVQEVLETIRDEKPTMFPGVPTMYVAIIHHPEADQYGLNSLRLCNSGSAPMPVELLKAFERKTGASILEGFGLSEAAPVTHCNPPFGERKYGSVGIGYPSTDYKVVDVANGVDEVELGEIGELIVSGPQVMKGYWNNEEETAIALRDGWLYTGDLARMDEDGYVSIVDRKKDLIISRGYNIYPRDVEEVLYEHPAVMEAVVIGVPDPYRGEQVQAVVVLKSGESITEEALIDYCSEHMAPYKVPKAIEFRQGLPKTNVGKILRRSIREQYQKQKSNT
ncbi:long-chain fatty acid--CoA ligase [Pontibacillus halophilus JSM 076056 = DSM 19796]|uniref:Long-chain fatty acid--CoA ligase n=1 Tax=Pontibacillus halophilus JSM 076056 = DSM 19796 TaxID=1385510 RepID=A0A0A5IAJ7_9BACI|nr:long-chain fatty acid--CoA ligase [Pontibacillus halophilus]KGX92862.1 long-chain fatty acid--CoA ligase [Pontibacillus halophilus JSM 076056 = DSM 19796]